MRKPSARERRRAIVNAYLEQNPCKRCGESDIRVLDFNHLDPSMKFMGVSRMIYSGKSIEAILEEIEKCEVLCANCHRIVHAEERGDYR